MSEATELHVVFGAGQVGSPLAEQLRAAGKRVRLVRRSGGEVPAGCEVVLGDAGDQSFCVRAAAGAASIYHCINPPYDARVWADAVPRYMENLIAAARPARSRLVVLDNVYMLGRPGGRLLDEDSPVQPVSRKGEIRARAAERLFAAHGRGEILATSGRASDFYGPGGRQTGLGDFFWPRALAGKTVYLPYRLDTLHTYHYIPDVASGLALLGCAADDVYGKPWMLPCQPPVTFPALVDRLASVLGKPIRIASIPRWILKAAAVAVPLMRELAEMLYQWDEPFVVDDRRFRARFQSEPAAVDEAARATARWAERQYAGSHSSG
jgi:nucleoside-diphosphate-sugar epimerase